MSANETGTDQTLMAPHSHPRKTTSTVFTLREPIRRFLLPALVAALLVPAMGVANGAPAISTAPGTDGSVTLERPTVSIAPDEPFEFTVAVELPAPASYLEARLRISRPGGPLVYQKTEVRNEVETSTVTFTFQRETADLDMPPGAYPIDLRVGIELGDDGRVVEHLLEGRLLIRDPSVEPTPLALVARVSCAPGIDPEGRFVIDPALATISREAAERIGLHILSNPSARMTLAIAPHTLAEWYEVSDGYESIGPEGVMTVPADNAVPRAFAQTLETLREAVATGRLELLDVPFADPDIGGLASSGLLSELPYHLVRGKEEYARTLDATPGAGTVLLGECVSVDSLRIMAPQGIEFVLADPTSCMSEDAEPAPGAYSSGVPGVDVLVLDTELSDYLVAGNIGEAIDHLFDIGHSESAHSPVAALIDLGPGMPARIDTFLANVNTLQGLPWIEAVDCADAMTSESAGRIELPESVSAGTPAPADYWPDVAESTRAARALERAAGSGDPDALLATTAAMLAQSRCWAGPDEGWGLADHGRAHSAAARRTFDAILGAVTIAAPDVTLSGSAGRIPVSILNGSDKTLLLTLDLDTFKLSTNDDSLQVTVRPSENFLTLPIDLQSSLSGRLDLRLRSGDVTVAEHSLSVQASYLDKLAVIGGVTILLGILLAFIRRRALSNDGTSDSGAHQSR